MVYLPQHLKQWLRRESRQREARGEAGRNMSELVVEILAEKWRAANPDQTEGA